MLVNVDVLSFYFFFWVCPIAALLGWALFVLFMFILMPESARLLLKLRFAKRASLGLIAGDDGVLNFEILEDKGMGIFKSVSKKGETRRYFFLPRPLFKGKTLLEAQTMKDTKLANKLGEAAATVDSEDKPIDASDRMVIEENLLKRHVLSDVKKPVYIGYTGKAIVTGVAALDEVTKSTALERSGEALDVDADDVQTLLKSVKEEESKKKPTEKKAKVAKALVESYVDSYLNVLDPRVWKQYLKKTSNQAAIDALCYTHEQIGAGDKKDMGFLIQVIIIAGIIFGAYFVLKYLKVI